MRDLVALNTRFVARTLRKAGVLPSDLDDEVQRTFIAFAGRLDDVRLGAEQSFLLQVAHNIAAHARRSFARRREVPSPFLDDCIEEQTTPEDLIVRKETQDVLVQALAGLDGALRAVFVLYELVGMDSYEIGRLLAVPRGTVATRLRRARTLLRERLAWLDAGAEPQLEAVTATEKPTIQSAT